MNSALLLFFTFLYNVYFDTSTIEHFRTTRSKYGPTSHPGITLSAHKRQPYYLMKSGGAKSDVHNSMVAAAKHLGIPSISINDSGTKKEEKLL